MEMAKRSRSALSSSSSPSPAVAASSAGESSVERLPEALLVEIAGLLDLESLFAVAPSCRSFCRASSVARASITRLDLSGFSPTTAILNSILRGNIVLQSLTLDCSLLDDSSIEVFAREHLQELSLLKCSSFSSIVFVTIGERCPNLRLLSVDLALSSAKGQLSLCKKALIQMFKGCLHLESVFLKFQLQHPGSFNFESLRPVLPGTLKTLFLHPIANWQAKQFVLINSLKHPSNNSLQSLSLVLDIITDELLAYIVSNLPQLVELYMEDDPLDDPDMHNDLTSSGLQVISLCPKLTRLSLQRGKQHSSCRFKKVNDFGILLLAEGCKQLEVIRLGGFSRVTDAGYASILHSCKNLKKFEIVNASGLSDLTFVDLSESPRTSLVEMRLLSCNLLTSETAISLSACMNLETLDLSGCRSIADDGLVSIVQLPMLRLLDVSGSDITDTGLSALGATTAPITSLCLRGCKRITNRGVTSLMRGCGTISKTLVELDLGYLPRVSDISVVVIFEACVQITKLCLRNCFSITDKSLVIICSQNGDSHRSSVRMLDLCHCIGLSTNFLQWLVHPFFSRLRWLGIGKTRLAGRRNGNIRVEELFGVKAGLKVCTHGCEIGCRDEWQHHR